MAKVKFNALLAGVSGSIQNLTVSKHGKKQRLGAKPGKPEKKRPISQEELATQLNFQLANSYSQRVKGTPELQPLWERYRAVATARGDPVFSVSNGDYLNLPVVDAIDGRGYRGRPGQVIRIRAHDDFDVRDVTVTIRALGTVIESGLAVLQPDDTWHYLTTAPAGEAGIVTIEAVARDWPGHQDSRSLNVDFAAPVVVDASPRARLVEQIREMAQRTGNYVLRNGTTRVNYFDKYRLVHSPALLHAIAEQLVPHVPAGTDALAGLELGGVPLATLLDAMLVEQIDVLRPKSLQRSLSHRFDVLRPAIQPALGAARIEIETKFCCHDDVIAKGGNGLADEFFILVGAVGFGGVEKRHPTFEGRTDEANSIGSICCGTIAVAQPHASQPQG